MRREYARRRRTYPAVELCAHSRRPQGHTWAGGTGRDGTGRDGTGRDGTGRDGTGRDGTGRDGTGADSVGRAGQARTGVLFPGTRELLRYPALDGLRAQAQAREHECTNGRWPAAAATAATRTLNTYCLSHTAQRKQTPHYRKMRLHCTSYSSNVCVRTVTNRKMMTAVYGKCSLSLKSHTRPPEPRIHWATLSSMPGFIGPCRTRAVNVGPAESAGSARDADEPPTEGSRSSDASDCARANRRGPALWRAQRKSEASVPRSPRSVCCSQSGCLPRTARIRRTRPTQNPSPCAPRVAPELILHAQRTLLQAQSELAAPVPTHRMLSNEVRLPVPESSPVARRILIRSTSTSCCLATRNATDRFGSDRSPRTK